MINQQAMAAAFKEATDKATTARVKANGERDGNAMRTARKVLQTKLEAAGVSADGAYKRSCTWNQANRYAA